MRRRCPVLTWANEIVARSLPRCLVGPLLLASACAANGPAGNQADVADRNQATTQLPGASDAEASLQYLPPENYLKFPPQVRELMRRVDIEDGPCQGYGDEREKYRACNRRHRLIVELERRGWCWGQGAVEVPISANDHWLLCSKIPTYRPGQLRSELPFPEVE